MRYTIISESDGEKIENRSTIAKVMGENVLLCLTHVVLSTTAEQSRVRYSAIATGWAWQSNNRNFPLPRRVIVPYLISVRQRFGRTKGPKISLSWGAVSSPKTESKSVQKFGVSLSCSVKQKSQKTLLTVVQA